MAGPGHRDTWRWRYRDDAEGMLITSNRAVLSEEEALSAARLAYPGVNRVVVPGPPAAAPPPEPVRAALRGWGRVATAVSLLAAVLLGRRQAPPTARAGKRNVGAAETGDAGLTGVRIWAGAVGATRGLVVVGRGGGVSG